MEKNEFVELNSHKNGALCDSLSEEQKEELHLAFEESENEENLINLKDFFKIINKEN